MAKVNTIANNGLTIVENYNKLLEQFRKTKTIDDVRILVASVRDFISVYKRVDKNMVNEIYGKLQDKLQDMVAENAFVYDRMNNRVEEIRNRGYDYANEKDDTQAVQSKALQLKNNVEWGQAKGFSKYLISTDGQVYSLKSDRLLPQGFTHRGYKQVDVCNDEGIKKHMRVHRLVYMAHKGVIPEGMQINHKDENKANNCIDNLELMTNKENCSYPNLCC